MYVKYAWFLKKKEKLRKYGSSIVVQNSSFFYFNYKPHKQNHLTNIQPNIYKKSHLNCPYKPLNNFLLNI